MNTLTLSTAEVLTVLQQIKQAKEKSEQIMADLDKQMKILSTNWTGEASETYQAVFLRFKKSVAANFENLMDTYQVVYKDSAETLQYDDAAVARTVDSSFSHK